MNHLSFLKERIIMSVKTTVLQKFPLCIGTYTNRTCLTGFNCLNLNSIRISIDVHLPKYLIKSHAQETCLI